MTSFEDRARAEAERRYQFTDSYEAAFAFEAGAEWAREQLAETLDHHREAIQTLSDELVEVGQRSPGALMKLQLEAVTAERDELKAAREQEPTEDEYAAATEAVRHYWETEGQVEKPPAEHQAGTARAALKAAKKADR